MPGLITVEELREIFEISDDIKDPRLERHVSAASRRLRGWIGDELYEEAESAEGDDPVRQDLELAEAHLAMHFAILGLNTALRPTGVVKTERVEGQVVITYHSPDEVAKLQQLYLETAESISRSHHSDAAAGDELGFAVLGDSCDTGEATTRLCGCSTPCSCV